MIEVAGILLAIGILVTLPFWLRLGSMAKGGRSLVGYDGVDR